MTFPCELNRLFPRSWRWAVKRLLKLPTGQLGHQIDEVDFRHGSRVILDVGANRGYFATNILLKNPLAEVHCFEPNPDVFPLLAKQCQLLGSEGGRPRALAVPLAVGAEVGTAELQVLAFDAASSLLAITNHATSGWSGVDFTLRRTTTVEMTTIERYASSASISSAKLLKCDVQGFELEVLKGCGAFLDQVEYVFTEVQFVPLYESAPLWDELLKFLFDRGFAPLSMAQFCLTGVGKALQA